MRQLTALVLAGTRAGGDPLAAYAGVSHKALIEVGGATMIERVVSTLAAAPDVARIIVAIERPDLLIGLPGLQPPLCCKPVSTMPTGSGPSATVAAALVREGTPLLVTTADHALLARKLNQETRLQTLRMGKKLAEVGARVAGCPEILERILSGHQPGCYPVVQGVLMARLGHSAQEAFAVAQYGLASAVVGAALRLMRVDHFETQRILFATGAIIEKQYQQLQSAELDDMASFSPTLDILAALHVQAHVRLFMN